MATISSRIATESVDLAPGLLQRHYCWPIGPSAADVAHLHLGQVHRLGRADLRVPVIPQVPDAAQARFDLVIGRCAPDQWAEVVTGDGEQAREEPAVRRDARPDAINAERLRHRGDQPDVAA